MDFSISAFLMSLRGAPLAVWLAMVWHYQSDKILSEGFLSTIVGYSEKTTRGALVVLVNHGLISRRPDRYTGYELTDYSVVLASTITAAIVGSEESVRAVAVTERNFTGRSVKSTVRDGRRAEYAALAGYGVGEPMRTRLTNLDWADLDYINYHFKRGLEVGDSIGLILHRIMSHDPVKRSRFEISQDPDKYREWLK